RVSFRARRLQQPFTLIQAQRLRMKFKLFRDGADRKCLGTLLHKTKAGFWTLIFGLCSWPSTVIWMSGVTFPDKDQSTKIKARLIQVPSSLADSRYSSANTYAEALSSPPRSLWAE